MEQRGHVLPALLAAVIFVVAGGALRATGLGSRSQSRGRSQNHNKGGARGDVLGTAGLAVEDAGRGTSTSDEHKHIVLNLVREGQGLGHNDVSVQSRGQIRDIDFRHIDMGSAVSGLLIPENRVEFYQAPELPYHTWVHLPDNCGDLDSEQQRIKAGCPDVPDTLLGYDSIGFSHTTKKLKTSSLGKLFGAGFWTGAFKIESPWRPHQTTKVRTGVPQACQRLVLSRVLNTFLGVDPDREPDEQEVKIMPYELDMAAVSGAREIYREGKLRLYEKATGAAKWLKKKLFGGDGSSSSYPNLEKKPQNYKASTTSLTTLDNPPSSAVCWTFTYRYQRALENWQWFINKDELGRTGDCTSQEARAAINRYARLYVPSQIVETQPDPNGGCLKRQLSFEIAVSDDVDEASAKKVAAQECHGAVDGPTTGFLLVDNRPAHPEPPQRIDGDQTYLSLVREERDLFKLNPYAKRSLWQYMKRWMWPKTHCEEHAGEWCEVRPSGDAMVRRVPAVAGQPPSSQARFKIAIAGDIQPLKRKLKVSMFKRAQTWRDAPVEVHRDMVDRVFRGTDLFIANIECAVISSSTPLDERPLVLQSRVSRVLSLIDGLGLRRDQVVLNVANNHALDGRSDAAEITRSLLADAGIHVAGYSTGTAAMRPEDLVTIVELKSDPRHGGEEAETLRVGVLGWTELMNGHPWDHEEDAEPNLPGVITGPKLLLSTDWDAIKRKKGIDVLVGTVHWGVENFAYPQLRDINDGQELIKRGFDTIVGHGPHLVQPVTFVPDSQDDTENNRLIFASMGNFIPSGMTAGPAMCGGVFTLSATRSAGLHAYQFHRTIVEVGSDEQQVLLPGALATSSSKCDEYFSKIFSDQGSEHVDMSNQPLPDGSADSPPRILSRPRLVRQNGMRDLSAAGD